MGRRGRLATLLALASPGLLAGLSDDDPAGITTYSILGAEYGYQMIWVLTLSTLALIVFHELGVRVGTVTGKGLLTLVREQYGARAVNGVLAALLVANTGTLCAELAGVAAGADLVGGIGKYFSVPVVAVGVSFLVLGGSFRRVEHVLVALCTVFVAYIAAGFLAGPDWSAAAKGSVLPTMPLTQNAVLTAVATIGTTLAPWGLVFVQSYAVDKGVGIRQLRYERIDVILGSALTGLIGLFVVVACAATLNVTGTSIDTASDAARALEPLVGSAAQSLFGVGLLGAAVLAAAIVPLSTAYSFTEASGKRGDIGDSYKIAPTFHVAFAAVMAVSAAIVLVPGAPLIPIIFLSQVVNTVLLIPILVFLLRIGRDRQLMQKHVLSRAGRLLTNTTLAAITGSVVVLTVLTIARA